MIDLQDVYKIYRLGGKEIRALDGVTFLAGEGEFVAVRGASGSGKSTLLALVGALASASSGTVKVDNQNLGAMSPGDRAAFRAERIGFVFQLFHLLPYLNILDNVLTASTARASAMRGRAQQLLEQFGLGERMSHRPAQLSAGERQRVAMARALLNKPKLLLADEPTGNLDPDNAAILLEHLSNFHREGGTVLLVTHDDRITQAADRIVHLQKGKIDLAAMTEQV